MSLKTFHTKLMQGHNIINLSTGITYRYDKTAGKLMKEDMNERTGRHEWVQSELNLFFHSIFMTEDEFKRKQDTGEDIV